jgi:hypothetical protein
MRYSQDDEWYVKITGCSDVFFWYRGKVGETVRIYGEEYDHLNHTKLYWAREDAGYLNFILGNDCELIER